MEFVPQLGSALWSLKGMYDQHGDNKNEIKRLQDFIQDYEERIPDLLARFNESGVSGRNRDDLQKLQLVILEATKKLKEWAADRSFFRVFTSAERMRELEHLQNTVMTSVQKALAFVNMSMLVHLVAGHNKLVAGQNRILEALVEARPPQAQPSQVTADQASSTMNQRSERYTAGQNPYPISTIRHQVLNEDHQLAAAENGVVYVIWKHPKLACSKVWIHTGQSDFKTCTKTEALPFRTTSPPFISGTSKLYHGVKTIPGGRPAVLVWKAEQFLYSLQSPRADNEWEYTILTHSSTGCVLYCGCSNGTIEVWNRHHNPNQPRVYSCKLTGHHVGAISGLAVGKNGTLVSVDMKQSSVVKLWCNLKPVAVLDLNHEKVHRMACTFERNLYIVSKGGSKLWCDLRNILDHKIDNSSPAVLGVGPIFSPDSGSIARSCLVVKGASETVCFLCTTSCNQGTYCIEAWRGREFVSRVDTGLKTLQAWSVSRNGTVYCSSRFTGEVFRWRLW